MMDRNRLLQLAGVPISERQTAFDKDDLKYRGYKLVQDKELEGSASYIWHCVKKNGKHVVTLDHNPREYIDEQTFKRYVDFFHKHGRWPRRDDFNAFSGPITNQMIQGLNENVSGSYDVDVDLEDEEEYIDISSTDANAVADDINHYENEKDLFYDVKRELRNLCSFAEYHREESEDYRVMIDLAESLITELDSHLDSYNQ